METLKLAVGPAVLALNFRDRSLAEDFREYFMGQTGEGDPDITIDLKISGRGMSGSVPNSLFLTKKKTFRGFTAGNGLIRGRRNGSSGLWKINVSRLLITGDFRRVFEQILYQAYVTAWRGRNTVQIHSCGVIREGKGYLFVGPSESGKSTVARLSRNFHVLNDEINIIDLDGETVLLRSTPFNGLFREKKEGCAPLKGIFLLNQAPHHQAVKTFGGKAVKALAGEIIPPVGLGEFIDGKTYLAMMDKAVEIGKRVPLYRMDFLPDARFWDVLAEL